jgi:PAS domain S-box-containing protein
MIDDDEEDYFITKEMLREFQGKKVSLTWASTYAGGVEALNSQDYDAVLVDYDLGTGNGIELISQFSDRRPSTPLILFTGRGSYAVDREALKAGATLYLTKAEATPLLLERSIRYAIERKQIEAQLRDSNRELARELGERSRIEEELRYVASFPEQNPNPITEVDLEGSISYMNPAARRRLPELPQQKTAHPWLAGWPEVARDFLNSAGEPMEREVTIGARVYHQTLTYNSRSRLMRIYGADITDRIRTETALRQSEDRIRVALKNIPAVVAILDRDLRYTWIYNPLANFKPEELIGRFVGVSLSPDARQAVVEKLTTLLATGQPVRWEISTQTPAGEKAFETFAETLRDSSGEIIGITYVSVDITERRRSDLALRRSQEIYSKAFLAGPSALVISYLADGRILEVNQSFEKFFGFSREEIIGKTSTELNMFVDPADREKAVQALLREGGLRNYEIDLRNRYGEVFTVLLSNEMLNLEGEQMMISLFHDVTERRRLAGLLGEKHEQLQRYSAELERSNQALEEFAFIASHELHEPLRKIFSFSETVRSRYRPDLPLEAQAYLDRIHNAAERMQGMLSALLTYSRVTTQVQPFQPVDLNALIADILSELDWQMTRENGRVEVGRLPTIQADPFQMRLLFHNLIANGLKFHRPDAPPEIKITSRSRSKKQVTVVIQDNGIGFDERFSEQIFKPFLRLNPRTAYEGAGMGLAICRKIVERHNGAITASGIPEHGATITVTLPRVQTAGAHP